MASAKFAPVAPIHILSQLLARGATQDFGTYHLFLAHHTVANPLGFRGLIRDYHRIMNRPSSLNIIMDNSLVELGGAVDNGMIKEACLICAPDNQSQDYIVPVLPDVMGNAAETIQAVTKAYPEWEAMEMPGQWMLVAQGNDNPLVCWKEFTDLINHFFVKNRSRYRRITWVGIPRRLVATLGTRQEAIRYVQAVAQHVRIHLLGFSETIWDDIQCARMPNVQGIDSAVPVRYDAELVPTTDEDMIGPRGDWFENGSLNIQNAQNIAAFRGWISSGYGKQ